MWKPMSLSLNEHAGERVAACVTNGQGNPISSIWYIIRAFEHLRQMSSLLETELWMQGVEDTTVDELTLLDI